MQLAASGPFIPLEAWCVWYREKFLILFFNSTPHWMWGEKQSSTCWTRFRSQGTERTTNKTSHPAAGCYSHTRIWYLFLPWSAASVHETQTDGKNPCQDIRFPHLLGAEKGDCCATFTGSLAVSLLSAVICLLCKEGGRCPITILRRWSFLPRSEHFCPW